MTEERAPYDVASESRESHPQRCQETARRIMQRTVQRWFRHIRNGQEDMAREQLEQLIAEASECRDNPPPRFPSP